MKTFTTLQIWEASERITQRLLSYPGETKEARNAIAAAFEAATIDLIQELAGPKDITLLKSKQVTIIPGIGFVPLVGTISPDKQLGNKITWEGE